MRIHVVSDVHGKTEALARAADGADALIVLGDLLYLIDHTDHSRGAPAVAAVLPTATPPAGRS